MDITYLCVLLQSGLPAVAQIMTPEALMVTSIAVACLGLAVMLLTRPRVEPATLENEAAENQERGEDAPAWPETPATKCAAPAAHEPAMKISTLDVERPVTLEKRVQAEAVAEPGVAAARSSGSAETEPALLSPTRASVRGPVHGASALIAKVASLLPAGVAAPRGGEKSSVKTSRGAAGFQPASRFSRSQQAFLRIPIVLTGRDESGAEFREETCTLILLPQGAVIPMRQRVRAGDRMMLTDPARQKEAACEVFGVLPGPDGRIMVEVEFPEPQKSMWPVSFPAWSGKAAGSASPASAARTVAPERAPALDSPGS